jgi:hypothetical protein
MVARPRAAKAAIADDAEAQPAKPSKSKPKPKSTAARASSPRAAPPRLAAGSPERSRKAPTEEPTKKEASSPRAAAGSAERSRSAPTKRSLVQRVYNTIDGELTKLEKQRGLTSQDRERASRALSQMVNALEKAVEMQREMTKRKTSGGDAKSKEALAHAEDLRREIAERLERLNRKRAPVRRSE